MANKYTDNTISTELSVRDNISKNKALAYLDIQPECPWLIRCTAVGVEDEVGGDVGVSGWSDGNERDSAAHRPGRERHLRTCLYVDVQMAGSCKNQKQG